MDLGRVGVFAGPLDLLNPAAAREGAAELEQLGFRTLWIAEGARRDVFVNACLLLGATQRTVVASGIANVYARDPIAMAMAHHALAEAFPDRFLLGLGVGHRTSVEEVRGHTYGSPVPTMRAYLGAMDKVEIAPSPPSPPLRRVLAALGPAMLRLAAYRAWGAYPFLVPVEHTAMARETMGTEPLLAVAQPFVFESSAARARELARAYVARFVSRENYANNLRRLGFGDADLAGGGSERLVESLVGWGSATDLERRIGEHVAAGADHVILHAITSDTAAPPWEAWRSAAPLT